MENKKTDKKETLKKGAIIILPVVFALIAATLAAVMIGGAKVASGGNESTPAASTPPPSNEVVAPVESTPSDAQTGVLEFRSNSDGTCTVIGTGSWRDKIVTIPSSSPSGETVTGISEGAFSGKSVKEIRIPSSVMSIGEGAFAGCLSLEAITVDGANPIFTSVSGVLFNREMTELICYPSGKSDSTYVIPKPVTRIAVSAFSSCANLTRVKYAGTEKQWNDVYVCVGNDVIVTSQITFAPAEK